MKTKSFIRNTKSQMAQTLKLPQDLAKGETLLSMAGKSDVYVENYKGILECSDTQVVIASVSCKIQFLGKQLHIAYYTDEEMKIEGVIQSISFM